MSLIILIIIAFGAKLAYEGFSGLAKHYSNNKRNTNVYDVDPRLADVYDLGGRAGSGDKEAQYKLGTLFYYGNGVNQNYKIAADWYQKAADQGHAKASYSLGLMYAKGHGVYRDGQKAVELFYIASQKGLPEAKQALEQMKNEGRDVEYIIRQYRQRTERTNNRSYDNNSFANTQINDNAENSIGREYFDKGYAYEKGNGVSVDKNFAMAMYEKAVEAGYQPAQEGLNRLKSERIYGEQKKSNPTPVVNKQQTNTPINAANYGLQDKYIKAQNSKLLFDQAVGLKRRGQYTAALMIYKQAYNVFPDDPDVQSTMYAMAKLYLLKGDYEKACTLFQDGLTMKLAQDDDRTARFYQKYLMSQYSGGLSESDPDYVWFQRLTADYSIFLGLSHYMLENNGAEL